jgi:predicted secreted hydrolase
MSARGGIGVRALLLAAGMGPLAMLFGAGLAACGGAGGATAAASDLQRSAVSPLEVLRGGVPGGASSADGFARALAVRRFEFPEDHGPHPQYRHEWWYLTGHLSAPSGARFGFELTFFRIALTPPLAEPLPQLTGARSGWRANQIYAAHFAITDVDRKQFHSSERYARDALGLAGARADPFRVWLEGWSLQGSGPNGAWTLEAADATYGLRLELRALGAPVLNGEAGLSIKSDLPGSASYYYSIPRLEARGELVRAGRSVPVSGLAWLDREWGSGSLGPHQQGWDWFALQLADGGALMFYRLRDERGGPDPHSAGTWIAADGTARALASGDVRIDVEDHWVSPHGVRYPSRWRVRVSGLGLDLELAPVLADQELDALPRYFEGDVNVTSRASGRPAGEGYVELVGYDSETRRPQPRSAQPHASATAPSASTPASD